MTGELASGIEEYRWRCSSATRDVPTARERNNEAKNKRISTATAACIHSWLLAQQA